MTVRKIIELRTQNVKKIKAVRILPDGSVVVIGGKNGAGKTSVLDSIMYALGGMDKVPQKPIREGQSEGKVVVDLGDIIVTRTFHEEREKSKLVVTNKEGAEFPSPQSMLNKLIGDLSFDPLEFSRQDPSKQAETLRQLAGLEFAVIDGSIEKLYEERTRVNRDVKRLEGKASDIPEGAPESEVSVSELSEELEVRQEYNAEMNSRQMEIKSLQKDVIREEDSLQDTIVQIDEYEETLQKLKLKRDQQAEKIKEMKESVERQEQEFISGFKKADIEEVKKQIEEAEEKNRLYYKAKESREALAELKEAKTESDRLTEEIQSLREKKESMLSQAKYPIDGLEIAPDGKTVLYNGVPFSQCSASEQLKVSVAMGLELNPDVPVLLVRDGSLLDEESFQVLSEMVAEKDAQVWFEKVGTGEDVSVIIEDGEISE